MDIALVSPPWPLFNRPSIQLGVLKAFLKRNLPPDTRIRNLHPYLRVATAIGFNDYHIVSQSSWASEAVFSNLLFPGRKGPERLFGNALKKRRVGSLSGDFRKICQRAKEAVEVYIQTLDFSNTKLVGISVCLNQLSAALFIARCIKEKYPKVPVVLGGASVSGGIGQGILKAFPWPDFIIDGEGELPLLNLTKYFLGFSNSVESSAVLSRNDPQMITKKEQVTAIDALPVPDYDDFFRELHSIEGCQGLNVVLPIEASRGCWWGRCSFCNLNLQWKGYRMKKIEQVARESRLLGDRYSCIDFAFMDNCLPRKQAAQIFDTISTHKRDYSFFAELRPGHTKNELERMARGGLDTVQIGIEALSTSLLRRLRKGVSTIDNLAAMKLCAELGIRLEANLITCFPGSTLKEVEETLYNLDFAWPFPPLKPVRFWLGMESPVFRLYKNFGIRSIRSDRRYKELFPDDIARKLVPLMFEYTGDRKSQARNWRPVEKKLLFFARRRKELAIYGPALTYRDGGHFLLIRHVLEDGKILNHRLSKLSRTLYLAAEEPIGVKKLFSIANNVPNEKIDTFLRQMVSKRLMFLEDGKVLSLACKYSSKNR